MTVDSTRTRAANQRDDVNDADDADDDEAPDDARRGEGSGAAPSREDTDGESSEDFDYEEAFKRERRERRRLARRLAEQRSTVAATGDVEQRATAAETRASTLETELRQERAYNRIAAAASRQGAIDSDSVAVLVIAEGIEFDDHGQPEGVEEAVKELLQRKPHFKGKPARTTGDAGRGRRGADDAEDQSDFNSAFRAMSGAPRNNRRGRS